MGEIELVHKASCLVVRGQLSWHSHKWTLQHRGTRRLFQFISGCCCLLLTTRYFGQVILFYAEYYPHIKYCSYHEQIVVTINWAVYSYQWLLLLVIWGFWWNSFPVSRLWKKMSYKKTVAYLVPDIDVILTILCYI